MIYLATRLDEIQSPDQGGLGEMGTVPYTTFIMFGRLYIRLKSNNQYSFSNSVLIFYWMNWLMPLAYSIQFESSLSTTPLRLRLSSSKVYLYNHWLTLNNFLELRRIRLTVDLITLNNQIELSITKNWKSR